MQEKNATKVWQAVHLRGGLGQFHCIQRQGAPIWWGSPHHTVLLRVAGQVVHQHNVVITLQQPVTPPLHRSGSFLEGVRSSVSIHQLCARPTTIQGHGGAMSACRKGTSQAD